MYDIKASKKMGDGILLSYDENGKTLFESFSFQELIDMKINVLDLIDRPMKYKIDRNAHLIVSQK
ncbi:hypothetical protein [Methanoregula sp.]|uniref:hypothetical protein n=1 Tax=Methanoregula sp. TaxID=2052170 RepID=UPI00236E9263|nr:hypothetical protein [Methanoregula sp.]MDD1685889.1 hypothetical protein [Methanoregula sp.]